MKRTSLLAAAGIVILAILWGLGCPIESPPQDTVVALKTVAIGDSITMGIQDAGLVHAFQENSYPYLIAKQMGVAGEFEQPYVNSPGIGVYPYERPLELSGGTILATYWPDTSPPDGVPDVDLYAILARLANRLLPVPYNNLGVNGAKLFDIRSTTTMSNSQSGDNFFFDIVLRNYPGLNPNFGGKTAVQEAALLEPDLILLWIGNNDVLGAVLQGCGLDNDQFDTLATSVSDFEDEYTNLLEDLMAISDKIVIATIPAYLPFGYALDGILVEGQLRLFDPTSFEPIDFDVDPTSTLYIPLVLEETDAAHLLLTGAIEYLEKGSGIPSRDDLVALGFSEAEADALVSALTAAGFTVPEASTPITGDFTMTASEETAVLTRIGAFNGVLESLSLSFGAPLVDIVESWWGDDPLETPNPFGGYSGSHAIQAQDTTTFSLDGVHPSNLGHALCANAFIRVLNQEYHTNIPLLDPASYAGQYSGKAIKARTLEAIKGIRRILDR